MRLLRYLGHMLWGVAVDLYDYARALRRNAILVFIAILVGGISAVAFLAVAPQRFESNAVLVVLANNPTSITEAQVGAQLAVSSATTTAALIESPVVLQGVADDVAGGFTVEQLADAISATTADGSSLVTVTVSADTPEAAQSIADAAAQQASRVTPTILSGVTDAGSAALRVDVIRPAQLPTAPASPNRNGVIGIGLLLGLCAGVAVAIVRFSIDTRIRDRDDLRTLALRVLGELPRRARGAVGSIAVRDAPLSVSGEAYRGLRTNIASLVSDREHSTVILAPVGSPHAISDVVAGLAWSMAETLRTTVVVDLDMRNPGIEHVLGMPAAKGAAEVLADTLPLEDAIRPTENARLFVIGAGSVSGSPSDLLASTQLTKFLTALEQRFEEVIVRAPSVSLYADAAIIARAAGSMVLVVRAGRDRTDEVEGAVSAVSTIADTSVGIVLDGARVRRRRSFLPEPRVRQRENVPSDDADVLVLEQALAASDHDPRYRRSQKPQAQDPEEAR